MRSQRSSPSPSRRSERHSKQIESDAALRCTAGAQTAPTASSAPIPRTVNVRADEQERELVVIDGSSARHVRQNPFGAHPSPPSFRAARNPCEPAGAFCSMDELLAAFLNARPLGRSRSLYSLLFNLFSAVPICLLRRMRRHEATWPLTSESDVKVDTRRCRPPPVGDDDGGVPGLQLYAGRHTLAAARAFEVGSPSSSRRSIT